VTDTRAELERYSAAGEGLLQSRPRGGILVRDEVIEHLDDRNLGAERAPCARELDADDPAAEDGHATGHRVECQRRL
jgi:hypothetical protein